jgi:hypothetical protein
MSGAPRQPSVSACPSCGSAISTGAVTCSCCGGVIAVEGALAQLRQEFRLIATKLGTYLANPDTLAWVLAVFPILILPPVLALFISLRRSSPAQSHNNRGWHRQDFFLPAIAICNILLSALFWRWLGELSMSGLSVGLFLKWIGFSFPAGSPNSI